MIAAFSKVSGQDIPYNFVSLCIGAMPVSIKRKICQDGKPNYHLLMCVEKLGVGRSLIQTVMTQKTSLYLKYIETNKRSL